MKYITLLNLIARLIFLVLIFLTVKSGDDYLLVPLLNGIGAFIGGILGLFIVFKKEKIVFTIQSRKTLWHYLKESSPIFASNIVISIKDKFNVFFIGIFLGMDKIAIYDLGVKIMNLFLQPTILINDAIYPKVAMDLKMHFVKKIMKISFFFILALVIIIQPVLATIVELFAGKDLSGVVPVARILLLAPLLFSISLPLSRNCIIVFGKYNLLLLGIVLTTLFYLVLIWIGYEFDIMHKVIVFAAITVFVYLFELLFRFIICHKLKLLT